MNDYTLPTYGTTNHTLAPTSGASADLYGLLPVVLLFVAFFLGDHLFDWFVPRCDGDQWIAVIGGLCALRLVFLHPMAALSLAFAIGDPVTDSYGHCLLGL